MPGRVGAALYGGDADEYQRMRWQLAEAFLEGQLCSLRYDPVRVVDVIVGIRAVSREDRRVVTAVERNVLDHYGTGYISRRISIDQGNRRVVPGH